MMFTPQTHEASGKFFSRTNTKLIQVVLDPVILPLVIVINISTTSSNSCSRTRATRGISTGAAVQLSQELLFSLQRTEHKVHCSGSGSCQTVSP